jgi:RNA ligase (TIGR02306 family)
MSDRKLATIRRIQEVKPIEGADLIEAVRVDNWWVVAKKGEYPVDTLAVYCEIDSWIPNSLAPFLTKPGHFPKEFQGIPGERLKTIKLKGQLSQGLLLPISVTKQWLGSWHVIEGLDITDSLGILKWEPPQEFMAANAKGTFPSFIPKTDQERIQNISQAQFQKWIDEGVEFERSEKIDGSSMTVFIKDGVVGVCSRNLELKEDEGNTFWKTAYSSGAVKALLDFCKPVYFSDIAIQGELIGPGIQGNSYGLTDFEFFVYDMFNISSNSYLAPQDVRDISTMFGLKTVPIIEKSGKIKSSVKQLLKDANGVSKLNPKAKREGDVYKAKNGVESFKVISNEWLCKTGN